MYSGRVEEDLVRDLQPTIAGDRLFASVCVLDNVNNPD